MLCRPVNIYAVCMSPAFSGNSVVQCFVCGNGLKMYDGIITQDCYIHCMCMHVHGSIFHFHVHSMVSRDGTCTLYMQMYLVHMA